MARFKPVRSDTGTYVNHYHYGILNAAGDFWSTLAFESEADARRYIVDFWGADENRARQYLRTHRIVRVRVRLDTLPPQEDSPDVKI